MDCVVFATKRAHLSYTIHANRHLAKWNLTAARVDLFVCHRSVLRVHGVVYQRDLCARLGVSRATVAVMLRRMEKRGLVERRRSDGDRRKVVVAITPAGYAAFDRARHLVDRVYREVVDSTLLFVEFEQPVHAKRARFLLYLDTLRTTFGDLTVNPYSIETGPVGPTAEARDGPTRALVEDLLRKFVA